jgi:hypothetical protein
VGGSGVRGKMRTCARIKVGDVELCLEKVNRGEERGTLDAVLVQFVRVAAWEVIDLSAPCDDGTSFWWNALGGEHAHDAMVKERMKEPSEDHCIRNVRHLELVQA